MTPNPKGEGFRVHWARIKRRIGTGSLDNPSSSNNDETIDNSGSASWNRPGPQSSENPSAGWTNVGGTEAEPDEVDEVVVDNSFWGSIGTEQPGDSQTNKSGSEKGPEIASTSHPHTDNQSTTTTSVWDRWFFLTVIRWRIVPFMVRFHSQAFMDPVAESQYCREIWYAYSWLGNDEILG